MLSSNLNQAAAHVMLLASSAIMSATRNAAAVAKRNATMNIANALTADISWKSYPKCIKYLVRYIPNMRWIVETLYDNVNAEFEVLPAGSHASLIRFMEIGREFWFRTTA